jgi:hypothetical protein
MLYTAGSLSAPTNVQLRQASATSLVALWDAPASHGVAGYRVYYSTAGFPDMDRWQSREVGPFTVAVISELDPHSPYAVRVRVHATDGEYGDFSDIVLIFMF